MVAAGHRKCLICRGFWRCRFDGFLRVLVDEFLSFRSSKTAAESVFVRYAISGVGGVWEPAAGVV